MNRTEQKFWLLFIIINVIQFLPAYLVNTDTSTFFPVHSFTHGYWYEIVKSFFKRDNYDIFRLSVDLTLWALLFYFFRNKINRVKISLIASVYFLLLLLFQVYYYLMYKIFLVEPILFNDISLLKLGYQNLGKDSILIAIGILLLMSALYYIFYLLFLKLFNHLQYVKFGKVSRAIIFTVGFILVANFIKSGILIHAHSEFQLGIGKLIDNLQHSARSAKNLSKLNLSTLNKISNRYKAYSLKAKPDIYLLFVESYGRIVYDDPRFSTLYSEMNKKCQKELSDSGWYIASDFSVSPISGGKSWISFSSVMFGFNIKNQSSYLYFLRNIESHAYTNVFRYFQSQGYKSYWINPMPDNTKMEIPWKLYTEFYGVDQWITYQELDYHGQLYGFGPVPPDQYSLFKGKQIIDKDENNPRIIFYITHNSHNPFFSPDSVVENWKTLNSGSNITSPPSIFIKKPKASDYIKSINYELEALTNFIVQSNSKNSIYILIGDHQPPVLSSERNGFETPVHIIASDSTLINNFYQYGFTKGLYVDDRSKSIRHEAIYSMLLREIIRRYGITTIELPEYSPQGIKTN